MIRSLPLPVLTLKDSDSVPHHDGRHLALARPVLVDHRSDWSRKVGHLDFDRRAGRRLVP